MKRELAGLAKIRIFFPFGFLVCRARPAGSRARRPDALDQLSLLFLVLILTITAYEHKPSQRWLILDSPAWQSELN